MVFEEFDRSSDRGRAVSGAWVALKRSGKMAEVAEEVGELVSISFAEAARITGLSSSTIYRLAMDPEYPDLEAVKLKGMRARINKAKLLAWAKGGG